jgi:uncharacterized protein (DUF433 family)
MDYIYMKQPGPKRRVKDVVKDIEAGVTDSYLMGKYDLSSGQLESLLRKIVNTGLVSQEQLDERLSLSDTAITKAFVEVQQSVQELDDTTTVVKQVERPKPVTPKPIQIKKDAKTPKKRRKVKAKALVIDIRAGLSDNELMEKYQVSSKQLQYLFGKLLDAQRIGELELWERTSLSNTSVTKAFVNVQNSLKNFESTQVINPQQINKNAQSSQNLVVTGKTKTFRTTKDS